MGVNKQDLMAVKDILVPGEIVAITATQRRVGPGGSLITPTTVVCTNKRIIIVNRATLGIRNDYETIPYKQITSVRLENGIINGSVFIRVQGYDRDKGLLKGGLEEGEIDGLHLSDAKLIADYVNRMIVEYTQEVTLEPEPDTKTAGGDVVFCSKCGAKNKLGANFCAACGAKLTGS